MDCTNARLLLTFVRSGEIDLPDREDLDNHLTSCSECAVSARAESRFDDALETAMPRVAIPAGLKDRILRTLANQRKPRPWPWVAAAGLLLVAGACAFYALVPGQQELDFARIAEKIDIKLTPEAVEAWFSGELGENLTAPREFNFNLLDNIDIAEVQGRKVAKLTFLSRGENRSALAYVYILPAHQFKLPAQQEEEAALKNSWLNEIAIPSSSHNVQIRRYPGVSDFFYLVVYTSGSLDPFLLQGI